MLPARKPTAKLPERQLLKTSNAKKLSFHRIRTCSLWLPLGRILFALTLITKTVVLKLHINLVRLLHNCTIFTSVAQLHISLVRQLAYLCLVENIVIAIHITYSVCIRDGNRSGRPAGRVEILRPAGQAG